MSLGWLKKRHMKPASTDSNIICFFSKRLDEGSGGIRGAFSRGIRGGSGSIWPGDPGGSGGIRGDPGGSAHFVRGWARSAGSRIHAVLLCQTREWPKCAIGLNGVSGWGNLAYYNIRAGQDPPPPVCGIVYEEFYTTPLPRRHVQPGRPADRLDDRLDGRLGLTSR